MNIRSQLPILFVLFAVLQAGAQEIEPLIPPVRFNLALHGGLSLISNDATSVLRFADQGRSFGATASLVGSRHFGMFVGYTHNRYQYSFDLIQAELDDAKAITREDGAPVTEAFFVGPCYSYDADIDPRFGLDIAPGIGLLSLRQPGVQVQKENNSLVELGGDYQLAPAFSVRAQGRYYLWDELSLGIGGEMIFYRESLDSRQQFYNAFVVLSYIVK